MPTQDAILENRGVPTKSITSQLLLILDYLNWPRGYNTFLCSTQLSTKFQLHIKTKIRKIKKFLALSLSDVVFIILINVKMPTIVGILTFMSRINFVLS